MKKLDIKERLKNHRNVQTHLWTGVLITGGGTLSVAQSPETFLNKSLFLIGVVFFFLFLYFYLNKNEQILKLTKKLED